MTFKKQLNLYIEVDVLTAGTTAEVVIAILESLLYQRNQIPFVYKTYRYYVNKWLKNGDEQLSQMQLSEVHSFQVQRKKQEATSTKKEICTMREIIKNSFEYNTVKSLRFLFGSTTFTAKEAYTIHIPTENIALDHLQNHHRISPAKLNQTLLSLLTSEDLYTIFSHNLSPTNIYLELEILENDSFESILSTDFKKKYQLFPKDFSQLPSSCKDIHLHLCYQHSPPIDYKQLKCCRELQVFEDIINLNLDCGDKHENKNNDEKDKSLVNAKPAWWEAEIVVHGFKDQPIKSYNIWT